MENVLRASLLRRRMRCGRPGCHCAQGKKHSLAVLTTSRKGGRTVQVSLRPEQVALAQEWIRAYTAWWEAMEKVSDRNRERLRRREVPESLSSRGRKGK